MLHGACGCHQVAGILIPSIRSSSIAQYLEFLRHFGCLGVWVSQSKHLIPGCFFFAVRSAHCVFVLVNRIPLVIQKKFKSEFLGKVIPCVIPCGVTFYVIRWHCMAQWNYKILRKINEKWDWVALYGTVDWCGESDSNRHAF